MSLGSKVSRGLGSRLMLSDDFNTLDDLPKSYFQTYSIYRRRKFETSLGDRATIKRTGNLRRLTILFLEKLGEVELIPVLDAPSKVEIESDVNNVVAEKIDVEFNFYFNDKSLVDKVNFNKSGADIYLLPKEDELADDEQRQGTTELLEFLDLQDTKDKGKTIKGVLTFRNWNANQPPNSSAVLIDTTKKDVDFFAKTFKKIEVKFDADAELYACSFKGIRGKKLVNFSYYYDDFFDKSIGTKIISTPIKIANGIVSYYSTFLDVYIQNVNTKTGSDYNIYIGDMVGIFDYSTSLLKVGTAENVLGFMYSLFDAPIYDTFIRNKGKQSEFSIGVSSYPENGVRRDLFDPELLAEFLQTETITTPVTSDFGSKAEYPDLYKEMWDDIWSFAVSTPPPETLEVVGVDLKGAVIPKTMTYFPWQNAGGVEAGNIHKDDSNNYNEHYKIVGWVANKIQESKTDGHKIFFDFLLKYYQKLSTGLESQRKARFRNGVYTHRQIREVFNELLSDFWVPATFYNKIAPVFIDLIVVNLQETEILFYENDDNNITFSISNISLKDFVGDETSTRLVVEFG